MNDFLTFLWAVINSWAGYLTGGLLVASFWLYFAWRRKSMSRNVVLVLAGLCLLMAFFRAWEDQKEISDQRMAAIASLQGKLDDLTKSNIQGEIVSALLGAQANGSTAALVVNLSNYGAESAIDPASWQLTVRFNGEDYLGNPNSLEDKNLDFCFPPHTVRRFVRADALYIKASNPIGHNGFTQGFLWFSLPTLDRSILVEPSTVLLLSAKSVAGQVITISASVQSLMSSSQKTAFFPGLENPRPLNIPCKENVPY